VRLAPKHTWEHSGKKGNDLGAPDASVIGGVLHQLARPLRGGEQIAVRENVRVFNVISAFGMVAFVLT